jgi:hypothetical protein
MREADWAIEIAAVGEIDEGEASVCLVVGTEAAVLRAACHGFRTGILEAESIPREFLSALEVLGTRPVHILVFSVLRAGLLNHHFAVFVVDRRIDYSEAFGAYGFSCVR